MEYTTEKWEVTSGKHHHVDEEGNRRTLRAGDRFHPRVDQVEKGSLENKARPLGDHRVRSMAGADIGLRSLTWGSEPALKKALDAGLSVEEMEAVGASGSTGFVTSDVTRALEAREGAGEDEDGDAETETETEEVDQ